MPEISWDAVRGVVAFALWVAGAAAALWAGAEAWRHLSGQSRLRAEKKRVQERLEALEDRVAACENRLQRGDRRFSDMRSDATQTLVVLNALLMHEITGNSIDRLKTVKTELDDYLSGRQTKGD